MVILFGAEKGGTGKTTTATNIAVELACRGVDVMLIDTDKQESASKWIERRNAARASGQSLPEVHCTQKFGEVYQTIRDLERRYQIIIVDAGGRLSKELSTAMVAADRMYVPLQASQADLETLPKMVELIDQARSFNPSLEVRALLTRAPSNPMINEVAEAQELLKEFPELILSQNIIRDRKVYRDALAAGRGVVEMTNSQAKAEIQLLCDEILENIDASKAASAEGVAV